MTASRHDGPGRWLGFAILGLLGAVLLWRSGAALVHLVVAIFYPFELDFGEGVVLQQAMLMLGPHAYGDITQYPFISFPYPPVFHMVVRGAMALGLDILVAGRAVSAAATLAIALMVFAGVWRLAAPLRRAPRIVGATGAAMLLLSVPFVASWAPLARVDMLAVALSMGAVALAARSVGSSARLHGAVLLAVLAVLTKQTSVAAPVAIVLGLLATRPRDGLRAMALGMALGLVAFGVLDWVTDGGFLRHLVVYNLSIRFLLGDFLAGVVETFALGGAGLLVLVVLAMGAGMRWVCGVGWRTPQGRAALGQDPRALFLLMVGIALIVSFLQLLLIGKVGSNLNYAIEWVAWACMPAGLALALMAATLTTDGSSTAPRLSVLPALLLLPGLLMPFLLRTTGNPAELRAQQAALYDEVRAADGPVLADDIVMLLRAGKTAPYQGDILTELARAGRWDPELIARRIRAREFALIVTEGWLEEGPFRGRYPPAVADAIAAAYPRRERHGGRFVHRPAE